MDKPEDICKKYCKQRVQNLTDGKPCPFHLISAELELKGEDLEMHTVCEGFVETSFKTIIDRITLIAKTGIKILREKIKHETLPRFGQDLDFPNIKWPKNDPLQPLQTPPLIQPGPIYPSPWTVTYSNSKSWNCSKEEDNEV